MQLIRKAPGQQQAKFKGINSGLRNVDPEGYSISAGGVTLRGKAEPPRTGFNRDQEEISRSSGLVQLRELRSTSAACKENCAKP